MSAHVGCITPCVFSCYREEELLRFVLDGYFIHGQHRLVTGLAVQHLHCEGDHFCEDQCLEVTPSLQAVMAENLLGYAYREYVHLLRLSRSLERLNCIIIILPVFDERDIGRGLSRGSGHVAMIPLP